MGEGVKVQEIEAENGERFQLVLHETPHERRMRVWKAPATDDSSRHEPEMLFERIDSP